MSEVKWQQTDRALPSAGVHVGQEHDTLPVHTLQRHPYDFLSALLPPRSVHHSACLLELCTHTGFLLNWPLFPK